MIVPHVPCEQRRGPKARDAFTQTRLDAHLWGLGRLALLGRSAGNVQQFLPR